MKLFSIAGREERRHSVLIVGSGSVLTHYLIVEDEDYSGFAVEKICFFLMMKNSRSPLRKIKWWKNSQ